MYRVAAAVFLSVWGALLPFNHLGAAAGGAPSTAAAGLNPGLLQAAGLPPDFEGRIDSNLAYRKSLAESDLDKAWLGQLKSFYGSRRGAPVWVTHAGFGKQALSAIAEISRAGDWGLRSADFQLPFVPDSGASLESLADAEIALSLAVTKYAHHARGGRIEPVALSLWLDHEPQPAYATAVMIEIVSTEDAGQALRNMHPRSEAFRRLQRAYVQMRDEMENPKARDPSEILPYGEKVKLGQWHPDVQKIRKRLDVKALGGFESKFDEALANALHNHLYANKLKPKWGVIDDRVRDVMNRPPPPPKQEDLLRVLANMERWRWVPADLGSTHVWNNLPEYMTRMYKDGELVHEERIIVGKPDTQTPVFSAKMLTVVFQPEWGVPPSIKIDELLPKLQDGDFGVLDRRDMRILSPKGKELDPDRFDWDKTDIRDVGIYQRAGDSNPLGLVKFLFPNKHHVYMHDTNNRALFKAEERSFSHGCVRLRNPDKFAELILGMDQGWSKEQIKKQLFNWGKPNNKIELLRPFNVHNVYFTLVPGEGDTLVQLPDIYGHDKRVGQALTGIPWKRIAANDPARNQQRELEESAPPAVKKALSKAKAKNGGDDGD